MGRLRSITATVVVCWLGGQAGRAGLALPVGMPGDHLTIWQYPSPCKAMTFIQLHPPPPRAALGSCLMRGEGTWKPQKWKSAIGCLVVLLVHRPHQYDMQSGRRAWQHLANFFRLSRPALGSECLSNPTLCASTLHTGLGATTSVHIE